MVELEGRLGGVDGHGDGADGGHGLLEGALAAVLDVHVAGVGGADVGGVEATLAVLQIKVRGSEKRDSCHYYY